MKSPGDKIRVHIGDDHQIIIDGLSAILEFDNDIKIVGYSINGNQVLDWFQENSADVLLLDINMPIVSGLDVLKSLKTHESPPKIIVLSSHDSIKIIKEVLNLGVTSFIPKKSAGEHIVKAIHSVVAGNQYFTDDVKQKMMNSMMSKPVVDDDENPDGLFITSLTKREHEILKLIAQQYSTNKIAEVLFISPSTVGTHRKNLIKKLKVKNSVGLALYAIKNKMI
jgi:DNA-binding NarL/FixJ family response regulator